MADEPQKTVVRANAQDAAGTLGVAGVDSSTPTTVIQMPIWQMVLVRVSRNYLQVVLGLLMADGLGAIEMAKDGSFWTVLFVSAKIALAPAAVALLQNVIEFLTRIDVNRPGLRA